MRTTKIESRLRSKLAGAKRIAVLAVGSELRGDDIAGLLVAEGIKKRRKNARLKVFLGSTAPENLTGEIIRYNPSHIIIVDTVEMGRKPGSIVMLAPEAIAAGATFSTHIMPARILVDYLLKSLKKCEAVLIGIQPRSLEFGVKPSKDVEKSAARISRNICAAAAATG